MDLTSIKAKIAAGVLPSANGVGAHAIRYVAGVCVGCDMTIRWSDLCIQFGVGSREACCTPTAMCCGPKPARLSDW